LLTALNHLEKNKNNNNHLDLKRIKIKYIGGERISKEKKRTRTLKRGDTENTQRKNRGNERGRKRKQRGEKEKNLH